MILLKLMTVMLWTWTICQPKIIEIKTEKNKSETSESDLSHDFFVSLALQNHVNYLCYNVDAIVRVKMEK